MIRTVVNVATGPYVKGQRRLIEALTRFDAGGINMWADYLPARSPTHADVPYAFKAFALQDAQTLNSDLVLWCDASILPIRSLQPLWERIERDGYWIARNGWSNYQWTADSAYADLFANEFGSGSVHLGEAQWLNRNIPHVVATSFGLNLRSEIGKAFLDEYFRLASKTKAFCGPWVNLTGCGHSENPHVGDCGPADVLGHRHDQTAASVIAWRLGMKLTDCPEIFAYSKRREDGTLHLSDQDERTILLADGKMDDGNVL
jgi:hypothetical protein